MDADKPMQGHLGMANWLHSHIASGGQGYPTYNTKQAIAVIHEKHRKGSGGAR